MRCSTVSRTRSCCACERACGTHTWGRVCVTSETVVTTENSLDDTGVENPHCPSSSTVEASALRVTEPLPATPVGSQICHEQRVAGEMGQNTVATPHTAIPAFSCAVSSSFVVEHMAPAPIVHGSSEAASTALGEKAHATQAIACCVASSSPGEHSVEPAPDIEHGAPVPVGENIAPPAHTSVMVCLRGRVRKLQTHV